MKRSTVFILVLISMNAMAQSELPFEEIPDYPESYTPANVVARLIEGLGYRYYWATEGLTEKDLNYRISDDARTAGENLEHIHGLSKSALRIITGDDTQRELADDTFETLRASTLNNLKEASLYLREEQPDLAKKPIISLRSNSEFPFWHLINGQVSDAIYHVGQIVSFRRASGNPINPNVSVFMGKNRN